MKAVGWLMRGAELALSLAEVLIPKGSKKPLRVGPTALELARRRMRSAADKRLKK